MVSVLEKQYMDTVIRMGRRMNSGEIDWEQRRYEIAFAVYMERRKHISTQQDDVEGSVKEADLLIAELKKNPIKE